MSFMAWQSLYIWRKCRTSEDFFDLYISLKAQFFSFHFFPISKIVQSTPTHMLLSDRHPIMSDSIRMPGIVTPQFSLASKTVHPPENGIVKFRASFLHQRITTQVNLFFLNSGAPGEWYNCGHMSFILNSYPANFNKGNSFTETCKQPQHQSSQMESCLDHML